MLRRLEIRDLALIEEAVLELGLGLTVLSGETGAGKSLLIGAIKGMTGARMGREWVREGAEQASLDAIWDDVASAVPEDLLRQIRDEEELEGDLYLGRTIQSTGRSVSRLDGRLMPLNRLKELGGYLADIHGQHDTQAIFHTESHLDLLDRFGVSRISEPLRAYEAVWDQLQDLARREKALVADPEARERVLEQLRFQTEELVEADFKVGEEEQLQSEALKLGQMDRYRVYLEEAMQALEGVEDWAHGQIPPGVLPSLALVEQAMMDASEIDAALQPLVDQVSVLKDEAEDLLAKIHRDLQLADQDPERLNEVEERLDLLARLKRKYGGSIERILQYQAKALEKLHELESSEQTLEAMAKERQALERALNLKGEALRQKRLEVSNELSGAIGAELHDLGMKDARFLVQMTPYDEGKAHRHGLDQIEFMLSANLGESPKPLARIASGGEAARIILAIKVILADADPIPLLVFDEIDTGVSGSTSSRIGSKLRSLGRTHQVLCVTHSAQIAALADAHILIHKVVEDGRTRTRLKPLSEEERILELARILSGTEVTPEARRLAEGLREEAKRTADSL